MEVEKRATLELGSKSEPAVPGLEDLGGGVEPAALEFRRSFSNGRGGGSETTGLIKGARRFTLAGGASGPLRSIVRLLSRF